MSVVRQSDATFLAQKHGRSDISRVVVVADRISADARRQLTDAGIAWLDRRGHFWMRVPGNYVNADIPSTAPVSPRVVDILSGTGFDVCLALLESPDVPVGVNELAAEDRPLAQQGLRDSCGPPAGGSSGEWQSSNGSRDVLGRRRQMEAALDSACSGAEARTGRPIPPFRHGRGARPGGADRRRNQLAAALCRRRHRHRGHRGCLWSIGRLDGGGDRSLPLHLCPVPGANGISGWISRCQSNRRGSGPGSG